MTQPSIQRLAQSLCAAELPEASVWLLDGTQDKIQVPSAWVRQLESLDQAPSSPAQIVALTELTPARVRDLAKAPPLLLILTGSKPVDPALLTALKEQCPELEILGPGAGLRVHPEGQGAQLAIDGAQLGAPAAPNAAPARIQIAPTPDWILAGLGGLRKQDQTIRGWVDTTSLSPQWRELLDGQDPPLLAACSPTPPSLDAKPWDPGLEAVALAHDLAAPIGRSFPATQESFHWLARAHQAAKDCGPLQWIPDRWDALFLHCAKAQGALAPELPPAISPLRAMPPMIAVAVAQAQQELERWRNYGGPEHTEAWIEDPPEAQRSLEVLQAASEQLTDHESKVVLKGWGFEVTRQAIGKSTSAALSYAQKLGYPVALKAISPRLRHKSQAQCVALDVANASKLKRHYQKINDLAIEAVGEDQLDGVLVSEMVPPGLDIQIRALKGKSGQWCVVARCQQGARKADASPPAWTALSTQPAWALRYAARIIPVQHPQHDSACEALAFELQKLIWPLQELGERLFCVELDPLRIFLDQSRPPTVLDAYIEQDAHIHGL